AVGQAEGAARMFGSVGVGVVDGVTVAFVFFVVVEGFGVGEDDAGAFAAGDGEFGIRGGKSFAVECQVDVDARRKGDGFLREAGKTWLLIGDVVKADDGSGFSWRELHVREFVGDQAPGVVAYRVGGVGAVGSGEDAVAHGCGGGKPVRAGLNAVPVPVEI